MQLAKLVTYTFPENVGTADRIFRVVIGVAVASAPAFTSLAVSWRTATIVVGVMIAITGVVSRCALYYMLGYTTCPLRDE